MEIVGEALLRVSHSLIAARAARARGDRHGDHPPAGARAVHARSCAASSPHARILPASSTAEAVRAVVAAARARAGGARHAAGGARSTAGRCSARASRTATTTKRASSGWRARRTARRGARAAAARSGADGGLEDLARLLGRRRRAPRLAGALPGRVRAPGHQPDEDRVAPAARAARAATCSSSTSPGAREDAAVARGARGRCARSARRCACSAPTRRRAEPAGRARLAPARTTTTSPLHCGAEDGEHSPTRAGGVRVALRAPAART